MKVKIDLVIGHNQLTQMLVHIGIDVDIGL